MAVFAWIMLGLAIWHFTVWVPDRFWGGIVGAFVGALIGSVLSGWLLSGLTLPTRDETDLATVLFSVPGALAGLVATYMIGAKRDTQGAVRI